MIDSIRTMVDFNRAVKDCTGGQSKVLRSDYLPTGQIPVIDQGQTFVAGYTNDDKMIFVGQLPVVLFGDHTRIFKYVDFPFALGADGVKVLSINKAFDPKYLFYYWKSCQIQSRGYSRHFKYLRQKQLPLIALSEQRRIVEILDHADGLCRKRAEADAKAVRIIPALFYKMFGDPAINPMRWEEASLGNVLKETQYGTSVKAEANGDGIAVIRMNNIDTTGRLDLTDLKYASLSENEQQHYALKQGDLLFNRTNSKELVGKTGLWRGQIRAVAASYLIRVRVDLSQVMPEYIWAYMNSRYIKQILYDRCRRAIGMANINARELRALPAFTPPLPLQQRFSSILAQNESLYSQIESAKDKLNRLFSTLLHRSFSCDLTARWRDAHMKKLLAEMALQRKLLDG